MTEIELKPIKESTEDFDMLEARIKETFKRLVYYPLLRELQEPRRTLQNASGEDALIEAIRSGRITFSRGKFSGKLNATLTKELKKLGAKWDSKSASFRLLSADLPDSLRSAVTLSETRFLEKIAGIDKKLAQILPEEIADSVKSADLFDRTLWRTNEAFEDSVKGITVAPKLTADQRARIAEEWQENMRLWIQNFTEEEITSLRAKIQKAAFAGVRRESVLQTIQTSYGVSANKAKFLAKQETSLLMAKFKETRYTDAGVHEYKWGCVAGTKNHPVRPAHKRLEGRIFRWDNPPITTEPGQPARRNNPGEDYGCRCFAKPVVRFKR